LSGAWAISGSNSIYGFQGGRYDIATGTNQFGERVYDPAVGTWDQKDPIGYPNGLDTYQFVGSNPVRMMDPAGTKILIAEIGAPPHIGAEAGQSIINSYKKEVQSAIDKIRIIRLMHSEFHVAQKS
jgi:RHS repeat-associated protein